MNAARLIGLGAALPRRSHPTLEGSGDGHGPRVTSAAERAMFTAGGSARRLSDDEEIESLMADAAREAMQQAGSQPSEIDRLYGYALLSDHVSPNGLFAVHRQLGLPRSCWVVPLATDFTNFLSSLAMAREAIAAGQARRVLVACGASLSRHLEPDSGYGVSIGDAAGAALVAAADCEETDDASLLIVGAAFDTESSLLEAATIDVAALERGGATSRFHLDPVLLPALHDHGIGRPVALVESLLARHGVRREEVTLIAHQPTRVLMAQWQSALQVAAVLDTYDTLGNATAASVPVTLALRKGDLKTPWAVLMSPGPGMHVMAVLLRVRPVRR